MSDTNQEMKQEYNKRQSGKKRIGFSLSAIFTCLVSGIVLLISIITILIFIGIYRDAMKQNAVTSSEQAVAQVENMVQSYIQDMQSVMESIRRSVQDVETDQEEFIQSLVDIREDVVAVMIYDDEGKMMSSWSNGKTLKKDYYKNLSYIEPSDGEMHISKPHVETLYEGFYPWVVTISQTLENESGEEYVVAVDIRFSNISDYVDGVGIGSHGYCYIEDMEANIIYHPQQQLIYSGLKEEEQVMGKDGVTVEDDVIHTVRTLEKGDWRIVGVCYVDEMITVKVEKMVGLLILLLVIVLFVAAFTGMILSKVLAKPAKELTKAMKAFEKNAENYTYTQVRGTEELMMLSDSFDHMVRRIQKLMEQVRQEEITLRKTELKALQAQINPHFLYNTLDAIAWLCEEGRNKDAEDMVTSLAKLFRISISKGHELITIEKEIQHAQSYLRIETFRYKNQFTYTFDVDENCLGYLCNKITLQPIIENAIYHGLNRMVDEGEITIRIREDGDDIILSVEDNGIGMTEEQCREILRKEPGDRTGIGIKNVNDRIKIYFGEEYGLTITSELDEGTCVDIRMPKVEKGDCDGK